MRIRKLSDLEIIQAIELKKRCWDIDFFGIIPEGLMNVEQESKEIINWVNDKNAKDIRKMYGAFEDNLLLGFIGASFSEEEDSPNGVEVNYLFVDKPYRGKALGLKLMHTVIVEYQHYSCNEVIVYNLHEGKSNQFYRSLNPLLLKQVNQRFGEKINLVDVFKWNLTELKKCIYNKLKKRSFEEGGLAVNQKLSDNVIMTTSCEENDYDFVCKNLLDYNVIKTEGLLRKPKTDFELYLKVGTKTIGAIFADTFNYSLYIDVLWIHEDYRNQKYGKELMKKAEEIARDNGCILAHTTTFSYQSPWFYKSCGYEVFAILDDYPNGIVQYFLKKKL